MWVASSWSRAMSWISRTSLSACCSVLVISRMIAWDFIVDSILSVFLRAAFPRLSLYEYIARVWFFSCRGAVFLKIYEVKVLNDWAAISWALVLPCARLMFNT